MSGPVTTSIVIAFSAKDATSLLKAEIDSRPDGYNEGSTTFYAGDKPVFLVFKSSDVTIKKIKTSEGTVSSLGETSIDVIEDLTFANVKSMDLQYPYSSGFSVMDASSGSYSIVGNAVKSNDVVVAAVKVKYKSKCTAYRVSGASGERQVVIFIEGESS